MQALETDEHFVDRNIWKAAIDEITKLSGIPGEVWGKEVIAEHVAFMEKRKASRKIDVKEATGKGSVNKTITVELNGVDDDLLVLGLETLLKRARSAGVAGFKFNSPEEIIGQQAFQDADGNRTHSGDLRLGYVVKWAKRRSVRDAYLKRLSIEGVQMKTPEAQIDFASLLAKSEIYDIARVQPPKGGSFIRGSRHKQAGSVILDTDGRKKRIFITAETVIPVEANGAKGAEVLRVYAKLHRNSDGKFSRYADRKDILVSFPDFMFLLPYVGRHIEGLKDVEDFIPPAPTDEELRAAGADPDSYMEAP